MKDNKQSFVDLGSKQKSLERDGKNQIDSWADRNKGEDHQIRNQAREEWDHLRHNTREGVGRVTVQAREGLDQLRDRMHVGRKK